MPSYDRKDIMIAYLFGYVQGFLIVTLAQTKSKKLISLIRQGIDIIDEARKMAEKSPSIYFSSADFYFIWGFSNSKLKTGDPRKTIKHYKAYLNHKINDVKKACAWNNISIAYRVMGECDKVFDAVENALELAIFRAARTSRRYAQFCQEMNLLGISAAKSERR